MPSALSSSFSCSSAPFMLPIASTICPSRNSSRSPSSSASIVPKVAKEAAAPTVVAAKSNAPAVATPVFRFAMSC